MYSSQRSLILCGFVIFLVVSMVAFQSPLRVLASESNNQEKTSNKSAEPNEKESEDQFFSYIKRSNTYTCRTKMRLGSGWGGWNMCLDEAFRPKQNDSLFYSFGIANDWSFDDTTANQFGATVRSFDPTIKAKPHRRASERGEIQFYHVGLTGSTERNATTEHLYSVPVLHEILDQRRVIDYLKFDVEGYEWGVVQDLIQFSSLRETIKQIGFEIHTKHIVACGTTPGFQCVAEYERYTRILNDLEKVGFKRWYYDINLNCGRLKKWLSQPCHCINVNYVNSKFINVK